MFEMAAQNFDFQKPVAYRIFRAQDKVCGNCVSPMYSILQNNFSTILRRTFTRFRKLEMCETQGFVFLQICIRDCGQRSAEESIHQSLPQSLPEFINGKWISPKSTMDFCIKHAQLDFKRNFNFKIFFVLDHTLQNVLSNWISKWSKSDPN